MRTPLEVARAELGVREATGRNDGTPAERYNDGEAKPWCAAFVRFCFEQAGRPLPGNRHKLPSVAYLEAELRAAGAEVARPEPGAVVTFTTRAGSDTGPGRHVGIVESIAGGTIRTIEGNTSNAVARRQYAAGDPRLAAFFVWPVRGAS